MRIRELNDRLRQEGVGGQIVCSSGIMALNPDMIGTIGDAVRCFDKFTSDNDPCGEHDFGMMSVGAYQVMFKIDAYDLDMMHASPNPADPSATKRVMTIMLAEEY